MKKLLSRGSVWVWLAALAFNGAAFIDTQLVAQEVDFESDVAPILEERCWYCHGEDEQEAALRLDRRPHMLRGGDSGLPAVVPERPDKSYLIEVIKHLDPDVKMPPDDDKLPDEEIDLLVRWIKQGAVWPGQMDAVAEVKSDHWAFQRVARPPVPNDGKTFDNPIDAFLHEQLEANGLGFSEPAKPAILIRRASIVLTGLPPTPKEVADFVDAFQADADAAYNALVDRLLESPHFGERWAQHWLDVIRWAETNGSEANLYRKNAWVYRDYVVRAFNEDKPYDQFVREQIAGDTLGVGEAMGFLVAGPHVPAATVGREPAAIRQARADRMDEIMQTVGPSIMGVTIGCARCHNHKFDPISIKDYYSMTAVFQDIEFGSRQPEYSSDHPLRQRGKELRQQIAAKRKLLRSLGGWEENWGAFREWHFKKVTTSAVRIRFKTPYVAIDELEVLGPDGLNKNLALRRRGSKLSGFPEAGVENRNPLDRVTDGEYGTMAWRARVDKDAEQKPWVQVEFKTPQEINRLRLSANREYFYDTDYLTQKPNLPRYEFDMDIRKADGSWQPWVGTWHVNKQLNEEHPERKRVLNEVQQCIGLLAEEGPRPSFVGRLVDPVATHLLHRGSPESPRDEVMPAGPLVFGGELGLTADASGAQRRAEFARWISSHDHPLTARVMVNRLWHHVFGAGIVTTTSDFGEAGARPSHPQLLQWLASEFQQPQSQQEQRQPGQSQPGQSQHGQPWSVKRMIRMMVTSRAFRQSSQPSEAGMQTDAGSVLLWRFPPKRVEAEVIRDGILLASGLLDQTVGGRSYRIHNEKKTYAQWEVVNNHGPETWRRMIYQERMRRVDDQMFTAFDFPDCGQVRGKRPVSTTPLQALNLLNSAFVLEQCDRIAQRAEKETNDLAASIDRCFSLLLSRPPDASERQACLAVAKQDGLARVCRALVNSNEFAFLP